MRQLKITTPTGSITMDADRPVVVGRAADADVRIEEASVSRRHLVLEAADEGWIVQDTSSSGTYADGERASTLTVATATTLRLGSPEGVELRLEPVMPPPAPPPVLEPDRAVEAGATVGVDDLTLRLELDGHRTAFPPDATVVVGRDDGCDVTTDREVVSRRHCELRHDGRTWRLRDLGSTRGTWVDGRRIRSEVPIEGTMEIGLGGAGGGAMLRVATAGEHLPAGPSRWPQWAALTAVVLVLAIGAFVLATPDGGPNTDAEIAVASAATVLVVGAQGTGSGAFVGDGLVLTNRHVADLAFPDGALYLASAEDEGATVEVRWRADVEAVHPYLDVALLRVTAGAELVGAEFRPVDASPTPEPLRVGDSTALSLGDEITALGFPSLTSPSGLLSEDEFLLPGVTQSRGDIVAVQEWPACDSTNLGVLVDPADCSTDGSLPRGQLLTDDISGSGGSGGPVVVGGELVAIRFAVVSPGERSASTQAAALSIPTEYFAGWLDSATDAAAARS